MSSSGARGSALVGVLVLLVLLGACSPSDGVDGSGDPGASDPSSGSAVIGAAPSALLSATCEDRLVVGPATPLPEELIEISGLAASERHPGVLWAIADGGSEASVFAVDLRGEVVGVIELAGVANNDWEDLAVGPSPDGVGGSWIYVADIGDNTAERERVRILALPEPDLDETAAAPLELVANYSTGATDAEAFAVTDAGLWVVVKTWGGDPDLFHLPGAAFGPAGASDRPTATFEPSGAEVDVDGGPVTAMDASASSGALVIRTYGAVRVYDQPTADLARSVTADSCETPPVIEAQGESVAVLADGSGLVTASEGRGSRPAELHVVTVS